ncbi:hypothetical protein THAOC_23055, partial [Thalassiosira oceanica]
HTALSSRRDEAVEPRLFHLYRDDSSWSRPPLSDVVRPTRDGTARGRAMPMPSCRPRRGRPGDGVLPGVLGHRAFFDQPRPRPRLPFQDLFAQLAGTSGLQLEPVFYLSKKLIRVGVRAHRFDRPKLARPVLPFSRAYRTRAENKKTIKAMRPPKLCPRYVFTVQMPNYDTLTKSTSDATDTRDRYCKLRCLEDIDRDGPITCRTFDLDVKWHGEYDKATAGA